MKTAYVLFTGLLLAGSSAAFAVTTPAVTTTDSDCPALLKHTLAGIDGKPRNLCQYRGQVVMVVNTASLCGYTPQYRQLQALYQSYHQRGFTILGFPANNFARQEPGSNAEIAKFCHDKYSVSFPMFAKTQVLGAQANPLFVQLTRKTGEAPLWNFHKYLINRQGTEVLSFGSGITPTGAKVRLAVEKMLKK
ncbi:MAG TPA: glutathione peroxidase [Candidatus Obscuribacterales bacterium]